MQQLKSKKFRLPVIYFVSSRDEIDKLPVGIPFIYGDEKDKDYFVRLLEYEVLYTAAKATGYPFNFEKILKDNGYDLIRFDFCSDFFFDPSVDSHTLAEILAKEDLSDLKENSRLKLLEFVKDSSVYVDIEKLKELKIIPTWLDNIEDAVKTNIVNFITVNPNMFNKKLGGMYGGIEMTPPSRNLIIIDISGSIPRGVSSTCLTLAKHLVTSLYADLMITGTKTTLYPYEEIHSLDIEKLYDENGMNNDQKYYKALVTREVKRYKTVVVFGDDHSPCDKWNSGKAITEKTGKEINKWEVEKVISFHTRNHSKIAGYARWFTPKEIEHIENWVQYL